MPDDIHTAINRLRQSAENEDWQFCVDYSEKIFVKYNLLNNRDRYALHCFNTYLKALWEIGAYTKGAEFADKLTAEDASSNPYICHNAACLYVAVGEFDKSMEQVKIASDYYYEHIDKLFNDKHLEPLFHRDDFQQVKKENAHLFDPEHFPSYKELLQIQNGEQAVEILFRRARTDYLNLFQEMVEQESEEKTLKKSFGQKKPRGVIYDSFTKDTKISEHIKLFEQTASVVGTNNVIIHHDNLFFDLLFYKFCEDHKVIHGKLSEL